MAATDTVRCYYFDRCGTEGGADPAAGGYEANDNGTIVGWICDGCAEDHDRARAFARAMREAHPDATYFHWRPLGGQRERGKVLMSWMLPD
jgi:hypothetical protein